MIFKPCFYGKIAQDSALSFMKENSCNPSPNYSFKALMKIAKRTQLLQVMYIR